MTVDEAASYGDFLQACTLELSGRPRSSSGKLLDPEDLVMACTLYSLVDEHQKLVRRMMDNE